MNGGTIFGYDITVHSNKRLFVSTLYCLLQGKYNMIPPHLEYLVLR